MARNLVDEDTLVEGVVRRTGLSRDDALRAVMVVAGELGEALTWGEAVNVADHLSGGPAQAVRAGASTTGGSNRYSSDMFLRIIAERLETDPGGAESRVVAFLLTLRDVLPGDRFAAIVEELPKHGALLGGPVDGRNHPDQPPAADDSG